MIKIQGLTKTYGNKEAVSQLNLQLNDGEVFGLLGPNGAGKSTTIKMITGILAPTSGDILIDGISITSNPIEAKKNFGFVPDSPDMFLGMSGLDYLTFIASVFKLDAETAKNESISLAKEFNIFDSLNELIINYSHGMRQKIFIIGSLLHNPRNWILDEPLTGLDPDSAFKVKNIMKERATKGGSVIFSTHVLDVAEKVCDKVGIIDKGILLFSGTLEELRSRENYKSGDLEDLFLNLTK
ncbi:MAG: ABC transporter ATP-binding protein [Bacilli bacterium]